MCDICNDQGLVLCFQPQPSASADSTYPSLHYSGYRKKLPNSNNLLSVNNKESLCFLSLQLCFNMGIVLHGSTSSSIPPSFLPFFLSFHCYRDQCEGWLSPHLHGDSWLILGRFASCGSGLYLNHHL